MHGWEHMNWGWEGIILQILFLAAIVWIIVWGIRSMVTKERGIETIPGKESAMDILKKRYAKGDINKKEFEEMKKNIA